MTFTPFCDRLVFVRTFADARQVCWFNRVQSKGIHSPRSFCVHLTLNNWAGVLSKEGADRTTKSRTGTRACVKVSRTHSTPINRGEALWEGESRLLDSERKMEGDSDGTNANTKLCLKPKVSNVEAVSLECVSVRLCLSPSSVSVFLRWLLCYAYVEIFPTTVHRQPQNSILAGPFESSRAFGKQSL